MFDAHKNFAISTVVAAPTPPTTGTSLGVAVGEGGLFPDPATDGPFNAVVWPAGVQPTKANAEIVRVTGRTGDTFTILRQQEGTNARSIVGGDQIAVALTAKSLTDIQRLLPFSIAWFGAKIDGATDDTAAVNAAIAAAAAVGGVVFHPGGICRCDGALVNPYTSPGGPIRSKPLRITGVGGGANGSWPVTGVANGGSIFDLRYNGVDLAHPAKIDSRGAGLLEIDHVSLVSGGTDNLPFVFVTGTTLHLHDALIQGNLAHNGRACVQDAVILGGTGLTGEGTANVDAPFQGYGTVIERVQFANVRECVLGQNYCNSIVIADNVVSLSCGSPDATHAAFHLNGALGGYQCQGCTLRDNLIETGDGGSAHYDYGIILDGARYNIVNGNADWDNPSLLAAVRCTTNASGNLILGAQTAGGGPYVSEQTPGQNTIITGGPNPMLQIGLGQIVMPSANQLFGVKADNGFFIATPEQVQIGEAAHYVNVGPAGTTEAWVFADGTDTDIDLKFRAKGAGVIYLLSKPRFEYAPATAATAGGNGDVPVQVQGYFPVEDWTGAIRMVPFYNP